MLSIQDRLFVSIKIDGQEVEYANLISIVATEGNGALTPAIKIAMGDPTSSFSTNKAFTDGNEIEITFAQSISDNQVYPRRYRIFGPTRGNQAFNPVIELVGILNAPDYLTKSVRESYRGTSEEVLKQLAAKCGLKFSGPSSVDGRVANDAQAWLNVCRNRATFAMDVVRHGWMDSHSGMSAAVTSYGELRYRDLIALINTPIDRIQFVFSHNSLPSQSDSKKKSYIVKEAKDRSSAGLMATWQNYGSTRAQNMLSGEHEISKELEVKMPGNYLPINKQVSDQVDRSRIDYAPLDCGNVHKKYEVAKYQNSKLNALFCEKMSLLIDTVTDVQLYDVVVYRQEDADLTQPVKNTDVYLVVGKTLVVSGGAFYAERIELARMSLTMKGTAELEMPGSAVSERSMIPDVNISSGNKGVIAAANRSNVSSLSKAFSSVSTGNGMLDNYKNLLISPLTGTMSTLERVYTSIANGNFSPANVTELLRSTNSIAGSLATLESTMKYASDANYGLIGALKNSSAAVTGQMLSQSNGVTTSLVNQYAIAMPLQATIRALSSTIGIMPKDVLAQAGDYQQFHSTLTQTMSSVGRLTGNTNGQWNSTLGAVRKMELPSYYPSGVSPVAVNLQQGLSVNNLSNSQLLGIVHSGMSKDSSGQPSWFGQNSMTLPPQTQYADSFNEANMYVNRLQATV